MNDYAAENAKRLEARLRYLHPDEQPNPCNVGYEDLMLLALRSSHPERTPKPKS